MSTITASLSDTLASTVPVLDTSGSNWAIFVFRFQDAVEAKGFWRHFDGSSVPPVFADVSAPTASETVAKAQWDKDERSARSLLTQKLPDSTVVLVHGKKTVRERWEAVVREFSRKSAYAQADLHAKFMGMQCSERGDPREFLEGLRMKREELAQAGVVVDEKDYFSVIISSLPVALSNFASNQLAAAQFLSSRSITPDDLLSMLMEESDCQRAQQQRRRGSGKGKDEESGDEALAAGVSKPRKGRANITCWTCDKVGHYSYECEEPSESDDEPKVDQEALKDDAKTSNDATAATVEPDDGCGGAWAAEAVAEEPDWFEMAIMEMDGDAETVTEEIPMRDWFDEVVKGEKESKDEVGNSKDTTVEGFGIYASGGAFVEEGMVVLGTGACMRTVPEDSGITGLFRTSCGDIEGTGTLPRTLLGSITLVVDLEGEYEDGETICETSSGMEPDLGVLGNPWIDDATMEWSNHAIALRASAEVVTRSLDNPKEGEGTLDVQVGESCDVGIIGDARDLEGAEMVGGVCEERPLVPRFEGEEDNQCETTDLLVAECPSLIEFPIVDIFDRAPKSMFGRVAKVLSSVPNPLVVCAKIVEGLETRYDASTTHTVVETRRNAGTTHIPRFEPFSIGVTYEKGQGGVKGLEKGGGLTIVDTAHLERPPGGVSMFVEPPTVGIFDPGDFAPKMTHEKVEELVTSVAHLLAGCVRFIEGAETHHDEWVVPFFLFIRFEPSWAIGTYGKGQVDVRSLCRGGGLTLDDIAHLLRPPGRVLERWWKETGLSSSIVDACHMVLAHQVISVFGALGAGALVSV